MKLGTITILNLVNCLARFSNLYFNLNAFRSVDLDETNRTGGN